MGQDVDVKGWVGQEVGNGLGGGCKGVGQDVDVRGRGKR